MMPVPDSICAAFDLPGGSNATILIQKIREVYPKVLDGLLSSDDSVNTAEKNLEQFGNYRLRVVDQINPLAHHKYCVLQFEGQSIPTLVGLIADDETAAVPTELESLMFWAALSQDLDWHDARRVTEEGEVIDWRGKSKGRAIIAEPIGSAQSNNKFIAAFFTLKDVGLSSSKHNIPIAFQATKIIVNWQNGGITEIQARLLFDANSEKNPKWRSLSFYRILENVYLNNIKQELLQKFDRDPRIAIEDAKKQLNSEINQLVTLAESADLRAEFVSFDEAFETLLQNNNTLIHGLDQEARGECLYRSEPQHRFKKGVLRLYKLRCAIAHAGTANVIYEQYSDADSAVVKLMPLIENIILKLLKIRVI